MKKTLAALLSAGMMVSAVSMTSVSAASNKAQALKSYNKVLSAKTINWSNNQKVSLKGSHFALVNLNKEATPELVVEANNNSMAEGQYAIYTFSKGKVQNVNITGIDGLAYYPKKNFVRVTRDGQGYTYDYYVMNNQPRQVLEETHFLNENDKVTKTYFNQSGKKVSLKNFNKQLKSYTGNVKAVKLTYSKNTAQNRKSLLK